MSRQNDINGSGMRRRFARRPWALGARSPARMGYDQPQWPAKSIRRNNLSIAIVPGHTAVVGVCLNMMPSRGVDHTRIQEVDHG
jgi:hypothetical protein